MCDLYFKHALIYFKKNNINMVMDLLKSYCWKTLFISVEHVFYEHLLSPYNNKRVIKNKTLPFIRFKPVDQIVQYCSLSWNWIHLVIFVSIGEK